MPAQLHHERIAREGQAPTRWLLMTHGIYGAGSNWRAIARKVNERRPEWGVILVDLRQHGRSEPGEPPHTLAACADDILALTTLLASAGTPVRALAGHSFGGKVMLAARARVDVAQTWMFDSTPSARPNDLDDPTNSVTRVLGVLERMSGRAWDKRDDFIAAVVAEGEQLGLAQWLGMNVVPDASGVLRLRLDTVALRAMLADYYAQDLWSTLEDPARGRMELVVADRAPVFGPADRARLVTLPPHVHVHHLDAGHWLHIEAPGAVVELLASELRD